MHRQRNCSCCGTSESGFTYIGILLTVALLGTTLAAVGQSWSIQKRRADEQQLLFAGQSFRRAIESYYTVTPLGANQYPTSLTDLIEDTRGGIRRRHLREVYPDPMTGRANWQILSLPGGGIIGVASRSDKRPLKRANFGDWEKEFENVDCYCNWRFVYLPQLAGTVAATQ